MVALSRLKIPAHDPDQRVVNTRVELLSDIDFEVFQCCDGGHWVAIGAFGREGVKGIRRAKYSGAEWNFVARERAGVTCSIPSLVVMLNVVEGSAQV